MSGVGNVRWALPILRTIPAHNENCHVIFIFPPLYCAPRTVALSGGSNVLLRPKTSGGAINWAYGSHGLSCAQYANVKFRTRAAGGPCRVFCPRAPLARGRPSRPLGALPLLSLDDLCGNRVADQNPTSVRPKNGVRSASSSPTPRWDARSAPPSRIPMLAEPWMGGSCLVSAGCP